MRRLERLMAISDTLRRNAPEPLSARRLAADFGVSERTIERDLAALRSAGVPLYAEFGRNGGAASLDRLGSVIVSLSPAEVTALLTAVDGAGESMPFADSGSTAIDRILEALPPETRLATERLRDRTRTLDEPTNPPNRRARRSVEEAVRRQVVVSIDYQDRDGNVTRRSVDPVGFLRHREGWYLIGWCHLRAAGRMFHLGRIARAHLTRRPSAHHDLEDTLGWVPETVSRP
ncbi:MAG: helix-turn-helix transcriptional regulator [Ilumatobacter sp.]